MMPSGAGEVAAFRALAEMESDEATRTGPMMAMKCPDCGGNGSIRCADQHGRAWVDECAGCHGEGIIEAARLRLVVAR